MKLLTRSEKSVLKRWNADAEIASWAEEAQRKTADVSVTITPHGNRATGCMHASSFTRSCDQFLLLELLGARGESRLPAKQRKILDAGTALHSLMDFYFITRAQEYGYQFREEVKIKDLPTARALRICGKADGVSAGWPLPNRRILWEFKTISKTSMANLRKPSKDYITQAHVYMGCLAIPVTAMTFYVKDNSETHTHLVFFDESIWKERIVKRAKRIIKIAEEITEDAPRHTGKGCYYCPYYNDCEPPIPPRPKQNQYGVPVP
jgi:hypothetical protein